MAYNTHGLHALVRISAVYTNTVTEAALDPDGVTLSIEDPSGTITTYTYGVGAVIVKDSTGNYHADIDADASGTWFYAWRGTGVGQSGEPDGRFVVPASRFS